MPKRPASDALSWLLEEDAANPGVRYFALLDLAGEPPNSAKVRQARKAIMAGGPVARILAAQLPDGTWPAAKARYQSTPWQLSLLSELGADPRDERVRATCEYVLENHPASSGALAYAPPATPSRAVHCHNGLQLHALQRLGYGDDKRVRAALAWQAQAITGPAPPGGYHKSATAGPGFACGINLGQPCGWGATKALRNLLAVPPAKRTPAIKAALKAGAEFLLKHDLAAANFPYTERISSTWFKFGFPLAYWSDLLETAEALADLGYGADPRLAGLLDLIRRKQDAQGRWQLENTLNGKTWADIELKGKPSKWVTLRALRTLHKAGA